MNTARYTRTAIVLHWLMALLIVGNLILGLYADGLPLSLLRLKTVSWHKWIGVTVLLLAALRLLWRLTHRPPEFGDTAAEWEKGVAIWAHRLLYLLFFAVPLSGWLMSSAYGYPVVYLELVPLPDLIGNQPEETRKLLNTVHTWLAYGMAALIALHIAGALKHQFQNRQGFLYRMGIGRPPKENP